MLKVANVEKHDFDATPIDPFWNFGDKKESKIHKIHVYPAKFPGFLTTKALEFAEENYGFRPNKIADIFCGSGTVAYEARQNNIAFWGCDLNPVATLIAKAKTSDYEEKLLEEYFNKIQERCSINTIYNGNIYEDANERLKYWYFKDQYIDLYSLKDSIVDCIPEESKYLSFFLCAFSNILKPTSKWLAKSIKPQIDPNKIPADVFNSFRLQVESMIKAVKESSTKYSPDIKIQTGNFLTIKNKPTVDVIITSPPYVTSYEYADLHQLSSLWLGFVDDYRDLRQESIGTLYNKRNPYKEEIKGLNLQGRNIVSNLYERDKSKAKSVAKYFINMQKVTLECREMLSKSGMALFVIGNTEYKGVKMDNARHLASSLYESGFKDVLITKRKISGKILPPYRDGNGRFTNDGSGRKIYSEEFILIGKK